MYRLFCFVFTFVVLLQTVTVQGCESNGDLVILMDSTQHVTAHDFGLQKSFINVLLFELDKTKVRLTTQVYSNESTCKDFIDDPQKSLRLVNDRDKIRSRLDTLKYDSSGGSYSLDCAKELAASQLSKKSNTIVLILATIKSVKTELDQLGKASNVSGLVCFVSTKAGEPYHVIQLSDVQNGVLEILKIICKKGQGVSKENVSSDVKIQATASNHYLSYSSSSSSSLELKTSIANKPLQRHHANRSQPLRHVSSQNLNLKTSSPSVRQYITVSMVVGFPMTSEPFILSSPRTYRNEKQTIFLSPISTETSIPSSSKIVYDQISPKGFTEQSQLNVVPSTSINLLQSNKISVKSMTLESPKPSRIGSSKPSMKILLTTSISPTPKSSKIKIVSESFKPITLPLANTSAISLKPSKLELISSKPTISLNQSIFSKSKEIFKKSSISLRSMVISKPTILLQPSMNSQIAVLSSSSVSGQLNASSFINSNIIPFNFKTPVITNTSSSVSLKQNLNGTTESVSERPIEAVNQTKIKEIRYQSIVFNNSNASQVVSSMRLIDKPIVMVNMSKTSFSLSSQVAITTVNVPANKTRIVNFNESHSIPPSVISSVNTNFVNKSVVIVSSSINATVIKDRTESQNMSKTTLTVLQSKLNSNLTSSIYVQHPVINVSISSFLLKQTSSIFANTSMKFSIGNQTLIPIATQSSVIKSDAISSSRLSINRTLSPSPLTNVSSSRSLRSSSILPKTKNQSRSISINKSKMIIPSVSSATSFVSKFSTIHFTSVINATVSPTGLLPWIPGVKTIATTAFTVLSSSVSERFVSPSTEATVVMSSVVTSSTDAMVMPTLATSLTTGYDVTSYVVSSRSSSEPIQQITTIRKASTAVQSMMLPSSIASSPSIPVLATSSLAIQPLVNLTKDIESFIGQEIKNETFADEVWVQSFVEKSSGFLNQLQNDNTTKVMNSSLLLVNYLEDVFINVARHSLEKSRKKRQFKSKSFSVEVNPVNTTSFNGYSFISEKESNNVVEKEGLFLPQDFFEDQDIEENAVIVAMEYKPLPVMQFNSKDNFKVADKVYVINVEPPLKAPFQRPFRYVMDVKTEPKFKVQCVYWNKRKWDTKGCETILEKNSSLVVCQCNHMTPFSVLMQVNEYEIPPDHRFALSLITYIGCGMSIAACLVLILSFMMCGKLVKINRNMIHINLAISIALSNALFIVADSVFKYKYICLGVSIAMLYSFLSSFFWMLVEGIHVYLMVVKVFQSSGKMKVYLMIGWFLPAVIVTLAGVKYHEYFTRPNFCWISTDHFLIWIFVGPALFVLTVNTVVLIMTLSASHKMCLNELEYNKLRKVARLTLLLMPVFGLSWVFGVLAVNKQFLVFQYIFTGLNAFQGVFLFLCYCVLNSEVRREFDRVRKKTSYTSSKSNGFADSAFSTYIHYSHTKPPRSNRSSALSTEDVPSTVMLTRFDPSGIPEDEDDYPESVSNTLTKRHKKNYSIELVRLPNTALSDEDDNLQEATDVTGLLTVDDKKNEIYRSSTFSDRSSRHDRSSPVDDLIKNDGHVYKTFQNQSDGTIVLAYQV